MGPLFLGQALCSSEAVSAVKGSGELRGDGLCWASEQRKQLEFFPVETNTSQASQISRTLFPFTAD